MLFSAFVGYIFFSGTGCYAVESPSMEPTLSVGDVIFVKDADFSALKPGDVITVRYYDNSGFFTHRITKIDHNNGLVYTKGDANNEQDPKPAEAARVMGKLWFSLPLLGYISLKFNAKAVVLGLAAVAVILVIARALVVGKRNLDEKKAQKP